jgi:hypothetical protein
MATDDAVRPFIVGDLGHLDFLFAEKCNGFEGHDQALLKDWFDHSRWIRRLR